MATYKKPASMETSSFLDKEGQFHFLVNLADEQPLTKDNAPIDGVKFDLSIVGGNEPSQVKRLFSPILFNPSDSQRDGGEFLSRVHLRMADACCLLSNANAGDEIEIDWSKAKGGQIIAYVKAGKDKNGKERLEIDGAHIYHVDDPEVAHVPKNEAMLKLLRPDQRRIQKAPPKQNGKAADTKTTAKTPPTTVTPPADETFDPDNL